jgi:phosphatidylcholine synthase
MSILDSDAVLRRAGYILHVMTATGAVAGMLALQAIIDDRIRDALLWLIFSQVLDGLDGPIARKLDVEIHADRIDGWVLDLVVDYLTCVVVPIVLLIRMDLFPNHYETLIAGSIFLFSALWFARTDLETDDHWFNGFPAVWNLVAATFLILGSSSKEILIVSAILCVSQLTNFKIPHLVRVKRLRWITLPFAVIYLVDLTLLSWNYDINAGSHANGIEQFILLAFPVYIFIYGVVETWFGGYLQYYFD